MTSEEAGMVLEIMAEADGGCSSCASHLFLRFEDTFPEHRVCVAEQWLVIFGDPWISFPAQEKPPVPLS